MKRIAKNLNMCQTFEEVIKAIVIGAKIYVPEDDQLINVTNLRVPDIKRSFDHAKMAIALTRDGKEEVSE